MKSILASLALLALILPAGAAAPPPTPTEPTTDTYHGTKVADPYRWLEDWSDPRVRTWSEAQNEHCREYLDGLPGRDAIADRVREILTADRESYWDLQYVAGTLYAMKYQPPAQQPFLVKLDPQRPPSEGQVLIDPNKMDPRGLTSIDWFRVSPDGQYLAASVSSAGTESGDLYIFETQSGTRVFEKIDRVNGGTAGGDMRWLPDSRSFLYTRYPREGERPKEDMNFHISVWKHTLGTPVSSDTVELTDLVRIAEVELQVDHDSGRMLATVQNGDGGEFEHYLRESNGQWRKFTRFGDRHIQAVFGPDNTLYVLSRNSAPRGKLLRVDIDTLNVSDGKIIIPEGQDTLVDSFWGEPSIHSTDALLYVTYQLGGPSEIRIFDHQGNSIPAPQQPAVASVGGITPIQGDDIMFSATTYIEPRSWYYFNVASLETRKSPLSSESPVDMSGASVVREFAVSKDGTRVPVNIIVPDGVKLDGSNPCVVNGYGGYGVSLAPRFRATNALLLDQKVIYAVANLRGGGEYGEQWHRQGNLTNKQNVFDDFAAVLQHMIDRGYTNPDKLCMIGGSNGGLLMGATMVQHPDLVKCVVSYVGIYDMLRVELSPNGEFNITEFGTVKNPDHFRAMYAYSPYHNVDDGVNYPATLFLTGANDPRVDPMQSRKMIARLQAATASEVPILLRTDMDSGHGATGLDEQIAQSTDVHAFMFHELGVRYRAPAN